MSHFNTCEAPHKIPPGRNGLETLYCNVVLQLEHLQLQNLRKTMKKYLQSTEIKDWMRFKRRKSIHPAPHKDPRVVDTEIQEQMNQRYCLPTRSVNLECQAFPKYWNQKVEDIGNRNERNLLDPSIQQERGREFGPVAVKPSRITSKAASNTKVQHLLNEPVDLPKLPQSSSELGRFRKSIETTKTYQRSSRTTTVACESKAKPRSPQVRLPTTKTECSSTVFHIGDPKYDYEDTTPTNKLETRPASITLRRELNCNTLIEEVKRQRALGAKLESGKREHLNAQIINNPTAIVILRSNKQPSVSNRNRNMSESQTRDEYKNFTSCSETPTSNYFQAKAFGLEEDVGSNRTTRQSNQIGSERPNSRSMLVSAPAQKRRPLAPEIILQDALEALECAQRWNEWGARTLHQLARASKAAVERNYLLLLDGYRINEPTKPEILLPHDNDIVFSTRRGRVLERREEERLFIRNLLVASGLTNGDWVDKHPLDAKHHHMVKRTQMTRYRQHLQKEDFRSTAEQKSKTKLLDQHILCDFVEELLRHELLLRNCAQPGVNLTALIQEHERKGQALVQKVWNNLQTHPFPASDGIRTTVQLVLEKDFKVQDPTSVEVAEVIRELEEMIYQSLMQELLEELG